MPAGAREAYFRSVFYCSRAAATYNMPGIQDLLIRVHHRPRDGRYVRFVFTPLEGRGMGISELQVFDSVTVTPWPGDVALLRK